MKKFSEWMEDNHPEELDEGFMKNMALAGALAAGAVGAMGWGGDKSAHPERPSAAQSQQEDDFEPEFNGPRRAMEHKAEKLRAAAQRVGIPKSQWNNLKGHMTGGVVTVVNGKKVPLTPKEAQQVRAIQDMGRRMGN